MVATGRAGSEVEPVGRHFTRGVGRHALVPRKDVRRHALKEKTGALDKDVPQHGGGQGTA